MRNSSGDGYPSNNRRSFLLLPSKPSWLVIAIFVVGLLAMAVRPSAAQTWVATGSMSTPRQPVVALLNNGEVLVAGGEADPTVPTAELYDPSTGVFTLTGSMTTGRGGASQFTATPLPNGKVLIAGGCDYVNDTSMSSAELYDPSTGTFTATGSMTISRSNHTATLLPSGEVLITGGLSDCFFSGSVISSAELYDPATGTFSPTGSMSFGSWNQTATLLGNGKVLVAGGGTSGPGFANAELYDPATGTFSSTGNMTVAREGHTATLLGNGEVLIAGGASTSTAPCSILSSAELYDPTTGTFTATGSLSTGRTSHTATLLPSGQVLIAGGGNCTAFLATAELYDPTVGTFTPTASMSNARGLPGAVLLGNGNVLVAGGANDSGALASAELFEPIAGPPTTTVSSSANPSAIGVAVTLTATVTPTSGTGTPTGTVTFTDTSTSTTLGTETLSSGQATLTTSSLAVGTHNITAQYSGDSNFQPSSGGLTQTVEYNICLLYDQTMAVHSGAVIPIKLEVCDANGNDLSTSAIIVHATGVVMVSTNTPGTLESPGNANADNDFRFDSTLGSSGGYIFNLGTGGLGTGTYNLQFTAGSDPVPHAAQFEVK